MKSTKKRIPIILGICIPIILIFFVVFVINVHFDLSFLFIHSIIT